MKLAILRQNYTPFGGAEKFIALAIETLAEFSELEITIVARNWPREGTPHSIKILICNPFYIGRTWRDISFAHQACKIIQEYKFDIVQSHEKTRCGDILRLGDGIHREWLTQRARKQSLWGRVLTRVSPYHNYLLWQERRALLNPKASSLIANSPITANEVIKWFPSVAPKIIVIRNAVDLAKFSTKLQEHRKWIRGKFGIDPRAHLSLFIGSGYERKGVKQLIRIFSYLPKSHHLIIIGKDKQLVFYKNLAEKDGLASRIHFLGAQQDIRPFMGAADLFLFPSLYDPLPNSTLEAAASGLPVLASKTTGAAELTKAIGIEPPDPLDTKAWVAKIKQIAAAKEIPILNMAPFSKEHMAHNLLKLYEEILNRK
jgi:UDP-glucose:(heptosyl)LPS alpha-1,3-glucosyltransferase